VIPGIPYSQRLGIADRNNRTLGKFILRKVFYDGKANKGKNIKEGAKKYA